jgi:hypothetical protein
VIVFAALGDVHVAVTFAGGESDADCPWARLPAAAATVQLAASAAPEPLMSSNPNATTTAALREARTVVVIGDPVQPGHAAATQLVQASVAGLVVAVAAPPEAVTPVNDGIWK